MPARRPSFLERADLSLLLFGGKGGVGKTTCALATALHLAARHPEKSFLVASTDPAHCLSAGLARSPLPPNLQLLEVDGQASLHRFKDAHGPELRAIALRGTFLGEDDVLQLLDLSLPGLDELMAFREIAALVEAGSYSCILLDTAPMGHTLRFLGLFEVIHRWLRALDTMLAKHRFLARLYSGSYRKDRVDLFLEDLEASFGRLAALLGDSSRCLFVPVMLAEQLSIVQTRRLLDQLAQLRVPVTDIVVNRLFPSDAACPACRAARIQQRRHVRRLSEGFREFRLWEVPLQGAEVQGADQLCGFWDGLRPLRENGSEAQAAPRLPLRVEHPAALPYAEARLLLFAGKGGVGKTTLACATALRLAEAYPGQEVLLFSTDPAHCLAACLDLPVGPQEVRVCPGLTAVEIDAAAEFNRIKTQYAEEIAAFCDGLTGDTTVDLGFDREVFERLMDLSPPGVDEVMALTRVVQLLEAKKYDFFVLDTAPSGHLIRLLELPRLVRDWLKVLFALFLKYKNVFRLPQITEFLVSLSKGIKALQSLLVDRRQGQLWLVSTPAELSLEKTHALLTACRRAGIHVPALFWNLVTPDGPCPLCHALAESEGRVRARFETAFPGIHQGVVYRREELLGRERLAELGRALYFNPFPDPKKGSDPVMLGGLTPFSDDDEREPCSQAAMTWTGP